MALHRLYALFTASMKLVIHSDDMLPVVFHSDNILPTETFNTTTQALIPLTQQDLRKYNTARLRKYKRGILLYGSRYYRRMTSLQRSIVVAFTGLHTIRKEQVLPNGQP